jgi:tRNA 2-thiouridine synthesizing protein A
MEEIDVHAVLDGGSKGCGELVFELAMRFRALAPGQVLHLLTTDLGAKHDVPAWCRLTGHALLRADPPHFFVRRKEG